METVVNNNKVGRVFMYIAGIFSIIASLACIILIGIDGVPKLLLGFLPTSEGGEMMILQYFTILIIAVPLILSLIQMILSIVCVVRNKKGGCVRMPRLLFWIALTFVLTYLILNFYGTYENILSKGITGGEEMDMFSMFNFTSIIVPILFAFVAVILGFVIKRNSRKNRGQLKNKVLSVVMFALAIIFLLSNIQGNIDAFGIGLFGKVVYIINLITLFLFLVEGIATIIYLIVKRPYINQDLAKNLEGEVVGNENGCRVEKRYVEKGFKSTASLVMSILFIVFVAATIIWEMATYIPSLADAAALVEKTSGIAVIWANITYLYRAIMIFALAGIAVYFVNASVGLLLPNKAKYFSATGTVLMLGVFYIFAHIVPTIYLIIGLMGFDPSNILILLPIIAVGIFLILMFVALGITGSAKRAMKKGIRSAEHMKKLAISTTLVLVGATLLFVLPLLSVWTFQFLPIIIAMIMLCVAFWLQVKKPRSEYYVVKTNVAPAIGVVAPQAAAVAAAPAENMPPRPKMPPRPEMPPKPEATEVAPEGEVVEDAE